MATTIVSSSNVANDRIGDPLSLERVKPKSLLSIMRRVNEGFAHNEVARSASVHDKSFV
jgi:hypothetical protein